MVYGSESDSYSSVGYYFHSSQPIEGSPHESYAAAFTGSGGISKVSWSNAYLLSRHWSLGANISYLFGNIVLSEQQSDLVVEKGCMRDRFMPI